MTETRSSIQNRARRGRCISRVATLLAALFCASTLSKSAFASSCNRDIVAQIAMAAGQVCWSYRGPATTFVGAFSGGQAISAQMVGEASDYDPRTGGVATSWRPRDPNVEGRADSSSARRKRRGSSPLSRPRTGPIASAFRPARCGAPPAWSRFALGDRRDSEPAAL